MEEFIQSRQNPRIKGVLKLQDRSVRNELGRFVVEGLRELSRCIESGCEVEEIYYCPEFFKSLKHADFVESVKGKFGICKVSESAFEKISNREGCDGLIAVCKQWGLALSDIEFKKNKPLILIADRIEKPGNLGALIRTADSLNADALILSNPVTDVFNPAVVRSSQGALFSLQMAISNIADIASWLKTNNIKSYAAYLDAKKTLTECVFDTPSAIVVGSEKDGLSEDWTNVVDEKVIIPMSGVSDSLNVNVAAAIFLWEAGKQVTFSA